MTTPAEKIASKLALQITTILTPDECRRIFGQRPEDMLVAAKLFRDSNHPSAAEVLQHLGEIMHFQTYGTKVSQ